MKQELYCFGVEAKFTKDLPAFFPDLSISIMDRCFDLIDCCGLSLSGLLSKNLLFPPLDGAIIDMFVFSIYSFNLRVNF